MARLFATSDVSVENYTSPVDSMVMHRFPTESVEQDVRKHDRWVIESLAYLTSFDNAASYEEYKSDASKPITLVVLTVNRTVPYLSLLVSMQIRGHPQDVFMQSMEVRIVNGEEEERVTTSSRSSVESCHSSISISGPRSVLGISISTTLP
mmetsp:Transcript_18446/g.53189  ORF Transcript_18446/g.53189 Transcript_18446/m.53189 type:complete len:151 (+) Transcript_18446:383-835(+)